MLKDLDQRQHEQHQKIDGAQQAMAAAKQPKTWLLIVITIMITLFIVFSVYLYQQNQQLSASLVAKKNNEATLIKNKTNNAIIPSIENNAHKNINSAFKEKEKSPIATQTKPLSLVEITNNNGVNKTSESKVIKNKQTTVDANIALVEITKATPEKSPEKPLVKNETVAPTAKVVKSSISVSRRKVSAQHLAKQKMQQAEDAVNQNELSKAETLFEDVLVLTPNNKAARKQLAALWFGRKSYQSALNLLSQGIALTPQDSEFRLMQARIYLTQGNSEKAYQVLQALDQSNDVEYLLTLANVAQKLGKYPQAIRAYKQLASKQPSEGRWWLGLAVAYDSNAEYLLAINGYRSAIAQGDLSKTSLQFAKKRLSELGE